MTVLHGNDVLLTLVLSTKKRYSNFLTKGFPFPENLFESLIIENVQNFH